VPRGGLALGFWIGISSAAVFWVIGVRGTESDESGFAEAWGQAHCADPLPPLIRSLTALASEASSTT
jgi:hypothetical protein